MPATDRLHALDAVRAYALLLGVALHSLAAFLDGFPIPLWSERPNTTAAVIYYVIHMFRMSAFFLIAGFFARMVVERRGVGAFVKDRGKRIALPLFVGAPIVLVTIGIGVALGTLPHGLDALNALAATQQPAAQPAVAASTFNFAHLWFLYYLLLFYAIALAVRAVFRAADGRGAIAGLCDRVVAFVMRGVWGPVLLGLPIAAYFLTLPAWSEWIGLPAPVEIVPRLDGLIGYGVPFALGWLLHRQIDPLLDLRKSWVVNLAVAVALTIVCLAIVGPAPVWQGATLAGAERVVYTLAYMSAVWFWVFALVGAAVRFLSDPHPVTRYLADASYWVYLMHLSTIVFFVALLRPYEWHWTIKLAIYIGGSMPILLLSYHYLVRFTWIGAVLNGRRRPRPGRSPAAATTAASCVVALVLLPGISSDAEAQSLTETELFKGNLDGWSVVDTQAGNFKVDAGMLRVEGPEGWLRSARRYGDFELAVEFRFLTDDADSGIFFRAAGDGAFARGWPNRSYQLQMLNPASDSRFPPVGWLFRHGMPDGETRYDEPLARRTSRPTGEWQTLQIRVAGAEVRASLNGVEVLAADNIGNETGHIGIQGETGALEFRSLRLREL